MTKLESLKQDLKYNQSEQKRIVLFVNSQFGKVDFSEISVALSKGKDLRFWEKLLIDEINRLESMLQHQKQCKQQTTQQRPQKQAER